MLKTTGYDKTRSKKLELFNTISSLITGKYAYLSGTRRSVGIIPFAIDLDHTLIEEKV